jgi:hypothetical protein
LRQGAYRQPEIPTKTLPAMDASLPANTDTTGGNVDS